MNNYRIFHITTCAISLFCSQIYAASATNIGAGSRSSGIQQSLENSLRKDSERQNFAPNALFYPPTHSMSPTTSLQNDTYLKNSLNWTYFRHPNGQLWAKNSFGDQMRLE